MLTVPLRLLRFAMALVEQDRWAEGPEQLVGLSYTYRDVSGVMPIEYKKCLQAQYGKGHWP
jgi:hypothetical protein